MQRKSAETGGKSSTRFGVRKWTSMLSPRDGKDGFWSENSQSRSSGDLRRSESLATRDGGSSVSGDAATLEALDPRRAASLQQLTERTRKLRTIVNGHQSPDNMFESYSKHRDQCLSDCKILLAKSDKRNSDLRRSVSTKTMDSISSHSSLMEIILAAVYDYKYLQEKLLETLKKSLVATYTEFEPNAPPEKLRLMLGDKTAREIQINKMRGHSVHSMLSKPPDFYLRYRIRWRSWDRLKLDLRDIEELLQEALVQEPAVPSPISSRKSSIAGPPAIPETGGSEMVMAERGDAILEFANLDTNGPVIRYRVSSHHLREVSPFFAQMFSATAAPSPRSLVKDVPSSPTVQSWPDGTTVSVYRMLQTEHNKRDAMSILLYACHMRMHELPRMVDFEQFVEIAQVCLKYQCISPLEMAVEYQWLPQWQDEVTEQTREGLLLIGWVFGANQLFTKVTKLTILTATDEQLHRKSVLPAVVRSKIATVRKAKFAQLYDLCSATMDQFLGPIRHLEQGSATGSLMLTTIPRCAEGSHACDAQNLGWLMLVYHELRVLGAVAKSDRTKPPRRRTLEELVDSLLLMPSCPEGHGSPCDFAPRFRHQVIAIFKSVTGLTLHNVSGLPGWGLSKRAGLTHDILTNDVVYELPAVVPVAERPLPRLPSIFDREVLALHILCHLNTLEDMQSAAMVNKTFYKAYKKKEVMLLRKLVQGSRVPSPNGPPQPETVAHARLVRGTGLTPPSPPSEGSANAVDKVYTPVSEKTAGLDDMQPLRSDRDMTLRISA